MNRLNTTKALVKTILEQNKAARSSDMRLYYEVCNSINPQILCCRFSDVIMNLDALRLPPFESVRRSRQKVQEEFPHLAACPEVELFRAENEEFYRDFARGNG